VFGALRDLELLSGICFWWRSPTFSAAISARRNPTCKPTDRMPGRGKPAIVSSQRVEQWNGSAAWRISRFRRSDA
jgi:hypothetical protein